MRDEKIIYRILHGSHLYGTNTPTSDLDYKEVFVPAGRDILLQRIKEGRSAGPKKEHEGQKNQAGDIDRQTFAVGKLFKMIAAGDIIGCELLFAPPSAIVYEHAWMQEIFDNADIFLSKKVEGYVGYCRQQANKYGIRGSRVSAVRGLLEILEGYDNHKDKLSYAWPDIVKYVDATEHCSIQDIENGGMGQSMLHVECCDRKAPITISIGEAYRIYKRVFDEYGHRALSAEKNEGIDWKAMSHAVRVGMQAVELLNTHRIKFPRPEAGDLLAIKKGEVDFKVVSGLLDGLLNRVLEASEKSTLPAAPNWEAIDELLVKFHERMI